MTLATGVTGNILPIENCFIEIPGFTGGDNGGAKIIFKILPEITDSKSASYNDEPILGRSMPLKTYSHSENRTITMNVHFIVTEKEDIIKNLSALRAIESAVYPREELGTQNNPFLPPPVCKVQCGELLAGTSNPELGGSPAPLCVVLKSYSINFPVNVPWDADGDNPTYLPYRFSMSLAWDVVYTSNDLPGQEKILQTGGAFGGI